MNSCVWWKSYLHLNPVIKVNAHALSRRQVYAWTDAECESNGLGRVVHCQGKLWFTAVTTPLHILEQLLHREDNQIGYLEMLAVVLLSSTFPDILSGSAATIFVDNDGVLGSLIKWSCRAPEVNIAVGRWWLRAAHSIDLCFGHGTLIG